MRFATGRLLREVTSRAYAVLFLCNRAFFMGSNEWACSLVSATERLLREVMSGHAGRGHYIRRLSARASKGHQGGR